MKVTRNRYCGFNANLSWSSACLAFLLRFAVAEVLSTSNVGTQQSPPTQVTEQEGLPVCVDIHPVPDSSKVVVLWETLPSAECSTTVSVEDEPTSFMTELRGRGVALSDIVSNKRYDVTVVCLEDGGKGNKRGSLHFQTGANEYSSSECTSAKWLKNEGANNLTVCINPPKAGGEFTISYNATTAIEKCYLKELPQSSSTPITEMVHVLPFSVYVPRNNDSINSTFSLECFYRPHDMNFIAGPVVSHGDKRLCATKFLVIKDQSDDPIISEAHQNYLLVHAGLLTFCILVTVICIALIAIFLWRKIILYRRRQGQRLLVNEDTDEAAFREYREMES